MRVPVMKVPIMMLVSGEIEEVGEIKVATDGQKYIKFDFPEKASVEQNFELSQILVYAYSEFYGLTQMDIPG